MNVILAVFRSRTQTRIFAEAMREVKEAGRRTGADGRSLYQAARWIVRRRTVGELSTLGQGPVVRILHRMAGVVEARKPFPPSLEKDWKIFN